MKLFKKYDHTEEKGKYQLGTIFGFGKLLHNKDFEDITTNEMGIQVSSMTRKQVSIGKFIRIELPFVKTITYVCPVEFVEKTGECRPTWLFAWRTPSNSNKKVFTKIFVWLPLEIIHSL